MSCDVGEVTEKLEIRLYNKGYARPPFWFCVEREREPVI